jgi:diguanylate cyclase (GGDEF)-like protein
MVRVDTRLVGTVYSDLFDYSAIAWGADMTASPTTRALVENRVLAEMARLATARYEYHDVVASVLDLIEEVVASPLLQLVMDEGSTVGCYDRVSEEVSSAWGEEIRDALQTVSEAVRVGTGTHIMRRFPGLGSSAATFGAVLRTGRWGALTLAAPGPIDLSNDEVRLLSRLVHQAALVLDHALLATHVDRMQTDDTLTGLLTHARLLEVLETEIARHRHFGRPLALVMIDIDGLDAINRSYSRRYGNHVLQKLAAQLRVLVRPVDVVARCGLDEFAVVLPETDGEGAGPVAEELSERLMGMEFAGGDVRVTVGAAHMRPDEVLAAEDLLRRGESALHASKRHSRAAAALLSRR